MTNTTTTSYNDPTTRALIEAARPHAGTDECMFVRMSDYALNFAEDLNDTLGN